MFVPPANPIAHPAAYYPYADTPPSTSITQIELPLFHFPEKHRHPYSKMCNVCNVCNALTCMSKHYCTVCNAFVKSVTALFNAFARCSPLSTFLGKCLCIQDNYERDSSRKNNFDKFCSSICIYQKLFVSLQPNLDLSSI